MSSQQLSSTYAGGSPICGVKMSFNSLFKRAKKEDDDMEGIVEMAKGCER
jgi:hypothetical protein